MNDAHKNLSTRRQDFLDSSDMLKEELEQKINARRIEIAAERGFLSKIRSLFSDKPSGHYGISTRPFNE